LLSCRKLLARSTCAISSMGGWSRPIGGRSRLAIVSSIVLITFCRIANCGVFDSFLGRAQGIGFPEPPDTRPAGCTRNPPDPEELGIKATIIIPYRNEPWEHILSSLKSVLHYTPRALLDAIMFVSDGNSVEAAHAEQLRQADKLVSVLELPHVVGLIAAKMQAVSAAPKSPVLVFLEPHIRVNRDWLEPMLLELIRHPRALVMPAMDLIPQEHFEQYYPGAPGHWRFEWNLNLIFTNPGIRDANSHHPFPSPATSGGIFAIRRDWWDHLGFYDAGMVGWGGDHLEATMKVWRCGGRIEILPCSRVGHRFRDPAHRPYEVDVMQVIHNYARLAEVWLDDHLPTFRRLKPEVRNMDLGSLTEQHEARKHLRCKNMTWYLHNIDLEMQWEEGRTCIPRHDCKGSIAAGRSTVDAIMPVDEYLRNVHWPEELADEPEEL